MKISKDIDPTNPVELQQWISEVSRLFDNLGHIKKIFETEATIDFGVIATNDYVDQTVTVEGAMADRDETVLVGFLNSPEPGVDFSAYVSGTHEVTLRATNLTTGSINPASNTYRLTVIEYE